MSQLDIFGPAPVWEQENELRRWFGDYRVEHCGHMTANWPYIAVTPDGECLKAPSGHAFRTLKQAKASVERHYWASLMGGFAK